jgi:hypothetical protein
LQRHAPGAGAGPGGRPADRLKDWPARLRQRGYGRRSWPRTGRRRRAA